MKVMPAARSVGCHGVSTLNYRQNLAHAFWSSIFISGKWIKIYRLFIVVSTLINGLR